MGVGTLAFDLEWSKRGIDVVGLAWEENGIIKAQAGGADKIPELVQRLNQAKEIVGHNIIDADMPRLSAAGFNLPLDCVRDTRLALHTTHGHLAGTGSYDLRSAVLICTSPNNAFPLDFKDYTHDIYRTCAMDAGASLFIWRRLRGLFAGDGAPCLLATAHRAQSIFTAIQKQGVRLDSTTLERIYRAREAKVSELVEKYQLWEERGKRVIKRVPIWRSRRLLDRYESHFGIRPADLQRETWRKLADHTSGDAREFALAIVELSLGSNDAHWLGRHHSSPNIGGLGELSGCLGFEKVGADGFIYPRYDLCGSPDRAVASGPNIQNFPRVSDDPRPVKLRSAVIPLESDHVILSADFSSIETITNAYESHDPDRITAVLGGFITHEGTAALVNRAFSLSLARQHGKAINHAFDKGESPFNLASRLFGGARPSNQHIAQCREIYAHMLQAYPKTARFRDQLWEQAAQNPLTVTNSFGRQLQCFSRAQYGETSGYARHDPAKKYWCSCRACAPRRDRWKGAIAFLGRSCAFDILLRAMVRIVTEKRLDRYSLPYLEVHDELDFSVPKAQVEMYAQRVKEALQEPVPELGGVVVKADVKWGPTWADAH